MKKLNMHAYKDELNWWQEFIGGEDVASLVNRVNPSNPVVDYIAKYMKSAEDKILDVGAGPLTQVGFLYEGKPVVIAAIDPLADAYNATPFPAPKPVTTQFGFGEDLSDLFPANTFDIAHARNSLDHSSDPLKCVYEMIRVTKPGGHIILHHCRSEGERANYSGLHQWNFYEQNGCFYISNRDRDTVINVTSQVAYIAEQVELATPGIYSAILQENVPWVDVCFRKYS